MRLNLGCGDRYADGWTNVDFGVPHQVDERVDLTGDLPWTPGTVTRAYAGHVLEHLSVADATALLTKLWVCMAPGGVIAVVGPDLDRAEAMAADGTFDFSYHNIDSLLHGAGRWAGDVHLWRCTGKQIEEMLAEAGWSDVTDTGIELLDGEWPVADRAPLWQCAVTAVAS